MRLRRRKKKGDERKKEERGRKEGKVENKDD